MEFGNNNAKDCNIVNFTAAYAAENDYKVNVLITYPILPEFYLSFEMTLKISQPRSEATSNGVQKLKDLSFNEALTIRIIKNEAIYGMVFMLAEDKYLNKISTK